MAVMWRRRRGLRRVRAASAARCARPLEVEAVAAVGAEAAVRVVAVRVVYLCLLERVVGVEQVSGLPAAAPQRELRARGLVVRRELGAALLHWLLRGVVLATHAVRSLPPTRGYLVT